MKLQDKNAERSSHYSGVSWDEKQGAWRAEAFDQDGKLYTIGYAPTEREAALIALPVWIDDLDKMPPHIQQTKIWQRNSNRLIELWIEATSNS